MYQEGVLAAPEVTAMDGHPYADVDTGRTSTAGLCCVRTSSHEQRQNRAAAFATVFVTALFSGAAVVAMVEEESPSSATPLVAAANAGATSSGRLSSSASFAEEEENTSYPSTEEADAPASASWDAVEYGEEALADEIIDLPGIDDDSFGFRQFSGMLDISETKHIHYWFVESEQDPANAPVTLWTNGGPGCSGLLGFMTEQGPFRAQADGSLQMNEWAWTKLSNMVFIEAPVGVGFSYTDDPSELVIGDDQTAEDNYATVLAFMERFPQFSENDFYISSESYGGHYMPTLATKIVEGNDAGENAYINFKGVAVGNPYTDPVENMQALFSTLGGHALLDFETYDGWVEECRDAEDGESENTYYSTTCLGYENLLWKQAVGLDPYALDFAVCDDTVQATGRAQRYQFSKYLRMATESGVMDAALEATTVVAEEEKPALRRRLLRAAGWTDGGQDEKELQTSNGDVVPEGSSEEYQPCTDDFEDAYLNNALVKEAIHVDVDIDWDMCSTTLSYEYGDMDNYMEPLWQNLIDNYDLDILIYSGDDDCVCGTWGTQKWTSELGYEELNPWSAWTWNGETAGYEIRYDGFTFATVHGAGHMVPTTKPEQSFQLFLRFLEGSWFDDVVAVANDHL